MKILNDGIGNRTTNIPTVSAANQPTAHRLFRYFPSNDKKIIRHIMASFETELFV
jgi:hypothetical protein